MLPTVTASRPSVFTAPNLLNRTHAKRIDRLVCQMHADRLAVLALEADAGFPPRSICPVRVVITARLTLVQRLRRALGLSWV